VGYYPLFLNISGKRCVVVGGGRVAERKAERLLSSGAVVVVVSPALTLRLQEMSAAGKIVHVNGTYDGAQLSGSFLVIAATSDSAVNRQVAFDARAAGVMVNVADNQSLGDFMLPSLLERGDLAIAVSTGGKSPALARKIRLELEALYGSEYSELIEILGKIRGMVVAGGMDSDENRETFDAVVHSDILDCIRAGRTDAVNDLIEKIVGAGRAGREVENR
jgi:precorrin-2 dehydrogenase/sirohydrochlorin ferrochelatase